MKKARAVGFALGAAVFVIPMGAAFCFIWWGWDVPGTESTSAPAQARGGKGRARAAGDGIRAQQSRRLARQRRFALPETDTLATEGPVRVTVARVGGARARIDLRNATEEKLRVVVPGGPGRSLRFVPVDARETGTPGLAYDEERDALVDLLPGDSYSRLVKAVLPGRPFRAIYDCRGEGLPEGAWSGLAISKAVR